jgi:hypothetical protein
MATGGVEVLALALAGVYYCGCRPAEVGGWE